MVIMVIPESHLGGLQLGVGNKLILKNMEQKMYWKKGFYDTPIEGSVEITVEYWQELIEGNSAGKLIAEDAEGYPILVEYKYDIEDVRKMKVSEIQQFDKSKDVNSFEFDGKSEWLDKSTRVGLFNSISIEEKAGMTDTALWLDGMKHIIRIPDALAMLNTIEIYAINCYNVTQSHIAAVNALTSIEEIEGYDYKVGYPVKLSFPG